MPHVPHMRKAGLALVSSFSTLVSVLTSQLENGRNSARNNLTPFRRGKHETGRAFLSLGILLFSGCSAVALCLLWPSSGVTSEAATETRSGAGATGTRAATSSFSGASVAHLIALEPQASYTLTASPSTIAPGGSLTVSWTAPSGRPTTDWIGLYRVGDPNSNYLSWVYTNGAASGSSGFSAPTQGGQY